MLQSLILAFQLYSRIPIPIEIPFNQKTMRYAVYFLPLVGLVIGAFTAFIMWLVQQVLPNLAGLAGLLAYIFISGGFHLDGLADTADGFLSQAPPEKTRQIMHDPVLGHFGTLALIIYALAKTLLYAEASPNSLILIILTSVLSRALVQVAIVNQPLSPSSSFGKVTKEALEGDKGPLALATLLFVGLIVWDPRHLGTVAVLLLSYYLLSRSAQRKIGGYTGDVYGALVEVAEILGLFSLLFFRNL